MSISDIEDEQRYIKVYLYRDPEKGTFSLSYPYAKNFFIPSIIKTKILINSIINDLAGYSYLEYDTIHPNNHIKRSNGLFCHSLAADVILLIMIDIKPVERGYYIKARGMENVLIQPKS